MTVTRIPIGLTRYIGLADAHGIESFKKRDETDNHFRTILAVRSQTNRQRHAVCFEALLTEQGEEKVNKRIEEEDFTGALKELKAYAVSLVIEKGWSNSWELIPNPKLDPWGGE